MSQKYSEIADQEERWYGVKYSTSPHSPELEQRWRDCGCHESIRLPSINSFIPHDFQLCSRDADDKNFPYIIKVTDPFLSSALLGMTL